MPPDLREKGILLSYSETDNKEVRSKLMQFDMLDDPTDEQAIVNFCSPFIKQK
jgi:hypothetical protein